MAERGWNMKVIGLKELENIMVKDLPNTVARRTLLGAIRVSAKPMRDAAKNKVVKQSGALAESIGLKTIRNRGFNKEFASMALSPMSGNLQAWAMYKDFYGGGGLGSTAAKIQSGSISARTARKGRIRHGHLVEFGFRHHSGKQVPARPFLRPAFDQEADGFVNSFRGHLAVRVKNAVEKIRKKNDAALRLSK